jgi:hypothetical protein
MLHRVALVTKDVSEERIVSITNATRIGELVFLLTVFRLLVTANVIPSLSILVTLMMEAIRFSEMSVIP